MLNFSTLFQEMINNFPKWTDIRKRSNKSNGGQLIAAIAEETANLQAAIDDYQKDFFIDTYFGKEDQVVSVVFKIQVGNADLDHLKIISHPISYTNDIKTFYENTGYYYFESGYLFFRSEDVSEDDKIIYTINEYDFSEIPTKYQVWNIFDEFAMFVGLERHEYESNLDLEHRILTVFKERINGTEDGLKYAIFSELLMLDPEITLNDIKIEGVNADNLSKINDDKEVIDTIAEINKDCYQYKKWDIDPWYYDINSIAYMPHIWDKELPAVKDGIGKSEDLSIFLSTPEDTTNATVSFYKKDSTTIESYIKKNATDFNLNLALTKYNNEINPIISKYKITASEALDITNDNIYLDYYSTKYINRSIKVQDVISKTNNAGDTLNIKTNKVDEFLEPNKSYKIKFTPVNITKELTIEKCNLINADTDDDINIVSENENYEYVDNNLSFKKVNKYVTSIFDLSEYHNAINSKSGITISPETNEAKLKLGLDNLNNKRIYTSYSCLKSNVPDKFITSSNFVKNGDNSYSNVFAPIETYFMFNILGNSVSFEVKGQAHITILKGNEKLYDNYFSSTIDDSFSFSIPPCKEPAWFSATIRPINSLQSLSINNLGYTYFTIKETLDHGNILNIPSKKASFLPDYSKNVLNITMTAHLEHSPVLEQIFIGDDYTLEEAAYYTPTFGIPVNTKFYLDIVAPNFIVELINVFQENGITYEKTIDSNYVTKYVTYTGLTNNSIIYLDLSNYSNIFSISATGGNVRSYRSDKGLEYLIELKKDETVGSIYIEGIMYGQKNSINLLDAFDLNTENSDKLYITNQIDGFICEKNNVQFIKHIYEIEQLSQILKSGVFDFSSSNREFKNIINKIYIKSYDTQEINNRIISSDKHSGSVRDILLKPKEKQTYIAYNQQTLFQEKLTNVEINDNFNPFIPNKLMCYMIESMDKNIEVCFENNNKLFSVGKNTIVINTNIDMTNTGNYYKETNKISIPVRLDKTIYLDRILTLDNRESIELAKYCISLDDGFMLNYQTINSATTSIEEQANFYGIETIQKQDAGYNKLTYCNIDEIIKFGIGNPNDANSFYSVNQNDYTLLKQEGIIVWNKSAGTKYDFDNIYIQYTIKLPVIVVLSDDILYEKTSYNLEGYKLEKTIDNIEIDQETQFLDLSEDECFNENYRIVVYCSNPNFDSSLAKTGIKFNRLISDNALFAKSGYYYIDGQEYYLFAQETSNYSDKNNNVSYSNVNKNGTQLLLNKTSNNYIANSMFNVSGLEEIYNKNFERNNTISGISSLNAITACNSFNHWNTVGVNLSFTKGLNEIGIQFTPFINDGYAYLNITDYLFEKSKISFYGNNSIEAYIGYSDLIDDMPLDNSISIKILSSIEASKKHDYIYEQTLNKENNKQYYLIVRGTGIIDDIVLLDEQNPTFNYHTKNIDALGLEIEEKINSVYTSRNYFYNKAGYKDLGAEITSDNKIRTSSSVNWGITKIKDYSTYSDWNTCEQKYVSVKNNMVMTYQENGYILTKPIFIGDIDLIKSLIIKINDVEFDTMSNFITTIYSSDTFDGVYSLKMSSNLNTNRILEKINTLSSYIKIKIDMPKNKVISNLSLFVEYKATENKAPIEIINKTGYLISEIYDTHYDKNFTLSNICINSISNINDVAIEIRAAKTNITENIWTPWKKIVLDSQLNLVNKLQFEGYRFFQLKVTLKNEEAYIDINYFDLEAEE